VQGDQLIQYGTSRIHKMEEDTDFSDLKHLDYLHDKHLLLKSFANELGKTVSTFEDQWRRSAEPPFGIPERHSYSALDASPISDTSIDEEGFRTTPSSSSSEGKSDSPHPVSRYSRPSVAIQTYSEGAEEERDPVYTTSSRSHVFNQNPVPDQIQLHDEVRNLIDSLAQRGTGRHICPYGASCNKGGIKDGKFLVFERNSAFRAHLLKHERMYICNMPYCTAKGGFARIDQLKRHQTFVSHVKDEAQM